MLFRSVFQGCAWQRCTVHLQRNLSAKVRSAKNERLVRELAKAVFAEGDPLVCRAAYGRACAAMRAAGEAGCADLLEAAQGDALQYLSLPREHWRRVRTNNVQERANREIKRRYRSVQSLSLIHIFGGQRAVLVVGDDAVHRLVGVAPAHRHALMPSPSAAPKLRLPVQLFQKSP